MKIEIFINGTLRVSAITDEMVTADYIRLIRDFMKIIASDRGALEQEANKSNRTIDHDGFVVFGSLPIPDSLDE
jgi:hypothetical protein